MKKRYNVSWKMMGQMTISAEDDEEAQEIFNHIEDVDEIVKHSIMIDCEATGASHALFDR